MKVCNNCGAYNGDERFFCVDCDEKLGDPLSSAEEQRLDDRIGDSVEAMYNRRDPLYVSRLDKVLGVISLAGVAVSLVALLMGAITGRRLSFLWIGVLFFLIAGVDALFPQIGWFFEKIRLSFHIQGADDAEPSDFYRICRRVGMFLGTAVGIAVLTVGLLDFRYPPVRKYITDIATTESAAIYSHTQAYIEENPETWQKILDTEDYAVGVFLDALEEASNTGLEEMLMMQAVVDITGREELPMVNKDLFILSYHSTLGGGQDHVYDH